MKIIKNGKLFGILNLLDILIIIFILALIIPMLHYYIKFNEKGFAEQKMLERYLRQQDRAVSTFKGEQKGTLTISVSFKDLTEEDLKKIKVGDEEFLPNGTTLGEVVWLGEPEPNYSIVVVKNHNSDQSEYKRVLANDKKYSLPAKLALTGYVWQGTFYYKAVAIIDLFRLRFVTPNYTAEFVVETQQDKVR